MSMLAAGFCIGLLMERYVPSINPLPWWVWAGQAVFALWAAHGDQWGRKR
jgi:hypothetical protein